MSKIDKINLNGTDLELAQAVETGSISSSVSGVQIYYEKIGNLIIINVESGGTALPYDDTLGGCRVGTLPSILTPTADTTYNVIIGRSTGAISSATYFTHMLRIGTDGSIDILGNKTDMTSTLYMKGSATHSLS